MSALEALRETLAVFTPDVREDTDYVVRPTSSLDDLGTVPGLTWGDLRAIEAAVREQIAQQLRAWVRHGRAVPADVTTYDRGLVNDELDALADDIARGGTR